MRSIKERLKERPKGTGEDRSWTTRIKEGLGERTSGKKYTLKWMTQYFDKGCYVTKFKSK